MELMQQLLDLIRGTASWAWRYPGFLQSPATGWTLQFETSLDPRKGLVTLVLWPEPAPDEVPF